MYSEIIWTAASCPHRGGFRNRRGGPYLKVPLYYLYMYARHIILPWAVAVFEVAVATTVVVGGG